MARLLVSLFGSFQVTLDGQPVTGFKSNKERALLVYLAVEADRPHRREVLAGLLWPDWPDRDALSNLRYALSNLRRVIGDHEAAPPFLAVTRDTLQFNTASDCWVDVKVMTDSLPKEKAYPPAIERLQQAVAVYQGSFLEGFSLGDSPAFEEWALFTRERLARLMSSALHQLAAAYEQRGEYEQALAWAWRQIELEPWDEAAHQQLMRTLAISGQRSAALAQYETCRRLLAEELGVEPAAETTQLYELIRDGKLKAPAPPPVPLPEFAAALPPFLGAAAPEAELPVFVSRKRELARVDELLESALAGQGRVVFVIGEAGSGKTALVQEFSRRAQVAHADLAVATGSCNAYSGIGDPYLPFREILGLLTGDVEARLAAGAMTRDHARRLWLAFPLALQALAESGPDLADTFVPRAALLGRAATSAPSELGWLTRREGVDGRMLAADFPARGLQQSDLFEQYTRVLQAIARQTPLVLVLDDLQWADIGSISLLFHLGRRLAGSRILLVGAYRREEVALGRDGARHPLEPVINEFQRDYGDITLNLDQVEGRDFVEAFLDSEPNRLGAAFREMLYRQTGGHPLFVVELLRGLQERKDLVRDPGGFWVEGPTLNWEKLPARVEAVIAERIARLSEPLQAALRVACVEGEVFTAEVVARVRSSDEREMLGLLSSELDRRHHLIRAESIQRVDGQLLSSYRFRNILFQKYLYGSEDEVERVYMHEQVGTALEVLYSTQERAESIAVQLALHFQKAGITQKAIYYLHRAGDRAIKLSAYQEAIAHLNSGLALLMTLPESPERDQQELGLQVSLVKSWIHLMPAPENETAITRAAELGRRMGKTTELGRMLVELSILHYVRADYRKALVLADDVLSLADQTGDPALVSLCHWCLGFILFGQGDYTAARSHLAEVVDSHESLEYHRPAVLIGANPRVSALAYDACCLWCLGYPDQALRRSQEALALARELDHAFSLADVLSFAGCLFNSLRRDAQALHDSAVELKRLSQGMGFTSFVGNGMCYIAEGLIRLGQIRRGITELHEGLARSDADGARCHTLGLLCALAEAYGKTGQPGEELSTLDKAFAQLEETDELIWQAELLRLQGELLLMQGDEAEAEASFQKAIEVAQRQRAKSWELRTTMSLCRLWRQQGRGDQARQMLAEVYGWFSEGFDTADLSEARILLEEMVQQPDF